MKGTDETRPRPSASDPHLAHGLGRRSVIKGAAWSVPVIAAAIATPLAAASATAPTALAFSSPMMTVSGCGVLTGVVVTGTNGSAPVAAGTPITITLPSGFTFTDGTASPIALPADANGQVALPSITAPVSASGQSLLATSGDATASAAVAVTAAIGSTLYGVAHGGAVVIADTGLPADSAITSVQSVGSVIFATLIDGTIWTQRDRYAGDRWSDTGLTGDAGSLVASGTSAALSEATVVAAGALHTFRWTSSTTHTPVTATLPYPPGGDPVRIAHLQGATATITAESPDGRLWRTPSSGASAGTWTEVTGAPTPVADWVGIAGTPSTVVAIGADGNLYQGGGGTLALSNHVSRTWTAPALSFAGANNPANAAIFSTQGGVMFADSSGGLYGYGNAQAINYAGVFQGRVAALPIVQTPVPLGNSVMYHTVVDGRLYSAGSDGGVSWTFKDITPPDSLLNGATIVAGHGASTGSTGLSIATDSTGQMWRSNRYLSGAATWTAIPSYPAEASVDGIVQDGGTLYTFGLPTTCA